MKFWHRLVGNIKHEVQAERVGWLVGSFIKRQLKAALALLPGLAAIALMENGTGKSVIVWSSFVLWGVWNALTLAIGTLYISRWTDKQYGKRPRLGKEYRKP